jgi:hypothetical protein
VTEDEDANEHEADDDDFDLTPEQREQLRTSMENLRRSLAPKFAFKFWTFKLPESTLKSFTAISAWIHHGSSHESGAEYANTLLTWENTA